MSITIALAGNPNSGKTTLFNALTGSNQFVGNWPGVTVEKKEGSLKQHNDIKIVDLPGIYSLSPYTMEEVVARDYLVGERPDAILNIIDGTNLERNLYLTTQLVELGIPVVAVINMMDVVRKNGDTIDITILSKHMGCRIVEISAIKSEGIIEAAEEAIRAAKDAKTIPHHNFSGAVEHALAHIEEAAVHDLPLEQQRWYAIKIFERDERVLQSMSIPEKTLAHIEEDIRAAEEELDDDADSIITNERYNFITSVLSKCYVKKNKGQLTTSDKIDLVMTNRWLGLPIFVLIMILVYSLAMAPSAFSSKLTVLSDNSFFENALDAINCSDTVKSLVLDGIIAGVGSVLGFVPQITILFFLLSFLEACGYMSRIAFVLDRLLRKFGLSGKSFIPILIGTGCGVPGIMASRTIDNERARRMTIITTTFIPCSAKLPLIAMIAGTFFAGSPFISVGAYFIGILAIIVSGTILKKTRMFSGDPAPFVMELPPYHMPTFANVLRATWDRVWSFIKKAGTIIFLSTIVIWFLSNFGFTENGFEMLSENEMSRSILAGIGGAIAWIFLPLGFGNWKAAVASITGLVAKENIVGTLGILYKDDVRTVSENLNAAFTSLSAFSFLIFNLLCAPCIAAMAAIKSEMNSGKWTGFAIAWQCGFAFSISMMIYQFGSAITGNTHVIGFVASLIILALMLHLLSRKERNPLAQKLSCGYGCSSCAMKDSCGSRED